MLHVKSFSQASIKTARPAHVQGEAAGALSKDHCQSGRSAKQARLDEFAKALASGAPVSPYVLFDKNLGYSTLFEQRSYFFHSSVTESGALAVVALLLVLQPELNHSEEGGAKISRKNLAYGLSAFFGKSLSSAAREACLNYANKMSFDCETRQIHSAHYHFQFPSKEALATPSFGSLDSPPDVATVVPSMSSDGELSDQSAVGSPRTPLSSTSRLSLVDSCDQQSFYNANLEDVVAFACRLRLDEGTPNYEFLTGLPGKYEQRLARSVDALPSPSISGKVAYDRTVAIGDQRVKISMTFAARTVPVLAQRLLSRGSEPLTDPVNLYTFSMGRVDDGGVTTNILCFASLTALKGDQPDSLSLRARGVVQQANIGSAPFIVGVSLLRAHIESDENKLFKGHVKAVTDALKEERVTVPYYPLLCNVASKPWVGATLPVSSTFAEAHALRDRQLQGKMTNLFNETFPIGHASRAKYLPILETWAKLLGLLGDQKYVAPFLTHTVILQGVLGFQIWMGCKSAKDRTTALLAGLSMIRPVIDGRLERGESIGNLFDSHGRLREAALTPAEVQLIGKLYDPQMMHAINHDTLGVDANIAGRVLTQGTFAELSFVRDPHTVGVGT